MTCKECRYFDSPLEESARTGMCCFEPEVEIRGKYRPACRHGEGVEDTRGYMSLEEIFMHLRDKGVFPLKGKH